MAAYKERKRVSKLRGKYNEYLRMQDPFENIPRSSKRLLLSHEKADNVLLIVSGALVNGPYALITTAVSADLGTHKSLHGNSKALATVSAVIDGTGSIGAAIGPQLTGFISSSSWNTVFYMLIGCNVAAFLLLARLVMKEIRPSKNCRI